ncbi:hypothetical protein [Pantoea ananatis]|uniref:hypothetical protein n=1 Tax=Pantoea ananas TaxID=553 RepID=UPI003CE6872E
MAINPKHVFNALVTDKNQPIQLLSYAIYKADKNEIAEALANANVSQVQIDAALQSYHDSVLNGLSIRDNYYQRAKNIGEDLIIELVEQTKEKARKDFIDRVMQMVKKEENFATKLGNFVVDAIRGVLSTLFVIILFGGIYSLTLAKDDRARFYQAVGKTVVDAAAGDIPVIDNYREMMKPSPAQTYQQLPSINPVNPPRQLQPRNTANPQNEVLPPNFQPPVNSGQQIMEYPTTPPRALPPLPPSATGR